MKVFTVKNKQGETHQVDEDKLHLAESDDFLPVVSNGTEEHRVSTSDLPKAMADGYKLLDTQKDVGQLKSFIENAKQGATLGFADEMGAASDALTKGTIADKIPSEMANSMGAVSSLVKPLVGIGNKLYDVATTDKTLGQSINEIKNDYSTGVDKKRALLQATQDQYPKTSMAGQFTGMAPLAALTGGGSIPLRIGVDTGLGAIQGAGDSSGENAGEIAMDALKGGALAGGVSAATAGLGQLAKASGISNFVQKQVMKKGKSLGQLAEKTMLNATGATGPQSLKFAEGSGRALLDSPEIGIRPFDNQLQIAQKVGDAKRRAGEGISEVLKELDSQGVTTNVNNLTDGIRAQINRLENSGYGNSEKVNELNKILSEITNNRTLTSERIPISKMENTKRNFGEKISNWENRQASDANKTAYLSARDETERAALEANPSLGKEFIQDKKMFGITAPIEQASKKRAAQLNQSPIGGLLDTATGGVVGGALGLFGGPDSSKAGALTGAVGGALLRRTITPRLASGAAFGIDSLSKVISSTPEVFGKYAPMLQQASQKGGTSLGVTHYLLQSKDPAYRQKLKEIYDNNEEE